MEGIDSYNGNTEGQRLEKNFGVEQHPFRFLNDALITAAVSGTSYENYNEEEKKRIKGLVRLAYDQRSDKNQSRDDFLRDVVSHNDFLGIGDAAEEFMEELYSDLDTF